MSRPNAVQERIKDVRKRKAEIERRIWDDMEMLEKIKDEENKLANTLESMMGSIS